MFPSKFSFVLSTVLATFTLMLLYATYSRLDAIHIPEVPPPTAGKNIQQYIAPSTETARMAVSKPSWESVPSWEEFYEFIENTTRCGRLEMFGGQNRSAAMKRDGEKAVCLDEGLAPSPGKCLVLSFGINNEWSFDDAMERFGCTVYAFDPTMNKTAHTRGKDIHFLPLGLGYKLEKVSHHRRTFEVLPYKKILETIGKTDSVVDYLKIDIEGYERGFFNNVLHEDVKLLDNVKQIGMEIHMGKNTDMRNELWRYIHQLLELNFSPVFSDPNMVGGNPFTHNGKKVSSCYELVWVNNKFK